MPDEDEVEGLNEQQELHLWAFTCLSEEQRANDEQEPPQVEHWVVEQFVFSSPDAD